MSRAPGIAAVAVSLLPSLAPPAAAQGAAVPPPSRFERILWTGDGASPERLAAIRGLGCTGVQLPRGGDPAPIVAAGLAFYLDQPVGKGVLELRDADWKPVQEAYERTRDPAVLVRPGCLGTPGLVARLAGEASAEALRVRGAALRFVALADEASATRHDAPLDTCRCAHCGAAFRAFARGRHGSIEALNAAWGTQYSGFDELVPVAVDALRRRELGDTVLPRNLRPFADRQDFVDAQFAGAVATIAQRVVAMVPGVPVGLTGLQVPAAFGGNDYARLLPALSLAEPYDQGGAPDLACWLAPAGTHRYATLFVPDAAAAEPPLPLARLVRAQLAAMAAHGLAGVVVWNDAAALDEANAPTPFGSALRAEFARLQPVLDACAGASVEASDVWLLESQASVRAWWMLDSAGDGMTWLRRLSSHEARHSTSQAARRSWARLLQDLGLQGRFVAESELPERLLRERPRCLCLPASIALADRTVQAIANYVRIGGTVLADHGAGLYDDRLVLRATGALDELFGVTGRSLRWADLQVRAGRSLADPAARAPVPLAEHETRGKLGERRGRGDVFLEHRAGSGRAVYLNAPVCEYDRVRLEPQQVARAVELRRRVRAVLQQAGVVPPCEVRGEGLPTCLERVPLRLRDGRRAVAIRVHALDRPALLAQLGAAGSRTVQVDWPAERRLRLLGGDDLGAAASFSLALDPCGALFLEDVGR